MNYKRNLNLAPSLPGIFAMTLMVFFSMLPRTMLSPLLLRISADLGISFDRASLFFLSSSAGFVIGLLSSGFVAQRITHKWTIFTAVLSTGITVIVLSTARSEIQVHLLFFLLGWVVGLYPGSGVTTVSTIAPDTHRGIALAIHECGPNFTFILAPILSAALAPLIGWRGVMLVIGIMAIIVALFFAVFFRAGEERGQPPSFGNIAELARNRSFWIVSSLFIVAATAAFGVFSVLPTYLIVDQGLSERLVNNLVGASRISGLATILTAGTLSDRYGFRPVVLIILLVTGTATILMGLAHGPLLILSVFLQPLIIGAYFPVALNALTEVTAPERRSLAVALAIPMANLVGAGIAPPLLTAAGARGWFSGAFITLGVFVLASSGLLLFMKKSAERVPIKTSIPE